MLIYTLGILLLFTSVIMILLVLIQRGRGGGLAGAFGGMGGQSALGVRAGDVFTKITVVIAIIWVLLAGILGIAMRSAALTDKTGTSMQLAADEEPEEGAPVAGGEVEDSAALGTQATGESEKTEGDSEGDSTGEAESADESGADAPTTEKEGATTADATESPKEAAADDKKATAEKKEATEEPESESKAAEKPSKDEAKKSDTEEKSE